ncbi:MAG: hypothetical protein ACKVYV_12780 [Limisphaerales bacterium]
MGHSDHRSSQAREAVWGLLRVGMFCASMQLTPAAERPQARIAIVGGTFINDALSLSGVLRTNFIVPTPLGDSPPIYYGETNGVPFYYVPNHGYVGRKGHWTQTWHALAQLGVKEIVGGATAGGINPLTKTFDLLVPSDFMDFNHDRPKYVPMEGLPNPPAGIPRFNPPMDPLLRQILFDEILKSVRGSPALADINVFDRGVVVQAGGARFETVSEIQHFRLIGGDVVTLNVGTEITYARQLGMHYACVIVVSNPAEGIAPWTWEELAGVYPRMNPLCLEILFRSLPRIAAIPAGVKRSGDEQRLHPEMTSEPKDD